MSSIILQNYKKIAIVCLNPIKSVREPSDSVEKGIFKKLFKNGVTWYTNHRTPLK